MVISIVFRCCHAGAYALCTRHDKRLCNACCRAFAVSKVSLRLSLRIGCQRIISFFPLQIYTPLGRRAMSAGVALLIIRVPLIV